MEKIIHSLGIDWKLLLAQAINFFILFFVLYKFLSQPLSKIIEERKRKIEEGLTIRAEAEKIIAEVSKDRLEILKRAEEERIKIIESAKDEKEKRLKDIRDELEKIRQKELENIESQKNMWQKEFLLQLYQSAPDILVSLASKVFRDEKLNKKFIENILNDDKNRRDNS